MGALTHKQTQFTYRVWEQKSFIEIDDTEVYTYKIRAENLKIKRVRILPIGYWISNGKRYISEIFVTRNIPMVVNSLRDLRIDRLYNESKQINYVLSSIKGYRKILDVLFESSNGINCFFAMKIIKYSIHTKFILLSDLLVNRMVVNRIDQPELTVNNFRNDIVLFSNIQLDSPVVTVFLSKLIDTHSFISYSTFPSNLLKTEIPFSIYNLVISTFSYFNLRYKTLLTSYLTLSFYLLLLNPRILVPNYMSYILYPFIQETLQKPVIVSTALPKHIFSSIFLSSHFSKFPLVLSKHVCDLFPVKFAHTKWLSRLFVVFSLLSSISILTYEFSSVFSSFVLHSLLSPSRLINTVSSAILSSKVSLYTVNFKDMFGIKPFFSALSKQTGFSKTYNKGKAKSASSPYTTFIRSFSSSRVLYSGPSKDAAKKAAKEIAKAAEHQEKPKFRLNSPSMSQSSNKPKASEPININQNNNPSMKILDKLTWIKDKVPSQTKSLPNNANNSIPITPKNRVVPGAIKKSGETYFNTTTNYQSKEYRLPQDSNLQDPDFDNSLLVGITLKNNNSTSEKTPGQKHVNVCTFNDKNQAVSVGYHTSSGQRDATGKPTLTKISAEKMDKSFVADKAVEVNTDPKNPADFIASIAVSEKAGGQYFSPYQQPLIVNLGDFIISTVGTEYIHNNPKVEEKLQIERQKVLAKNLPPKVYDPTEKNIPPDAKDIL